jgi:hypothetical protein
MTTVATQLQFQVFLLQILPVSIHYGKLTKKENWGVIQKQGSNQFIFSCLINLQDGCYLNDTDKQITLASGVMTVNGQYFIGGSGTITLGKVIDYSSKASSNGVSFYCAGQTYWYYWIWTGHEYIYSSLFSAGSESQALVYAYSPLEFNRNRKGFCWFSC